VARCSRKLIAILSTGSEVSIIVQTAAKRKARLYLHLQCVHGGISIGIATIHYYLQAHALLVSADYTCHVIVGFERGPLKGAFFATSSFALSFAFSRSPPPPCWNLASGGTPESTKRGHGRAEERGKHQREGQLILASASSLTSNELFGTI
jgi:hypothetical protein